MFTYANVSIALCLMFALGVVYYLIKRKSAPVTKVTISLRRPEFDRKTLPIQQWLNDEIEWLKNAIAEKQRQHDAETPEVNEKIYVGLLLLVVGLMVGYAYWVFLLNPLPVTIIGTEFNLQWFFFLPLMMYVAAGLQSIPLDKVGGLDFFGTPVHQYGHGLKWYPWLLFNLTLESSQLVQGEYPGDADTIDWGDEKNPLTEGKVRPIYVLTGENPAGDLPSDKQVNLGISMAAKFQLVEERFFDLVRNIAPIDPENAERIRKTVTGNVSVTDRLLEVLRHLRDTGAALAAEVVGKLSYNELTANRGKIDEWLMLRIQLEVITWGLKLTEARFTNLNPGHAYNQLMQKRIEAQNERDATILKGEGEKQRRILEGEGTRGAADAMGVTQQEVFEYDVAKVAAGSGNLVIAPNGNFAALGALFGVGAEKAKRKGTTT